MTRKRQLEKVVLANKHISCDPAIIFPDLHIGKYRFTCRTERKDSAGGNIGSALRGMLGWSLREICCPWNDCPSGGCSMHSHCPWYMLYATETNITGFSNPPRPYILMPLQGKGLQFEFSLTLVGDVQQLLPSIIEAIEFGGRTYGLHRKGRMQFFVLDSVDQCFPYDLPKLYSPGETQAGYDLSHWLALPTEIPASTGWQIFMRSPLRLRKKNCYLDKVDWTFAFKTLAGRLSLLNQLSGGVRLESEIWDALMNLFTWPGQIRTTTSHWNDWHRFSSTQNKHVPMGGRVDAIEVTPPPETAQMWLRWWRTAELLHLGKGTTMGNGALQLNYQK